MEEGTGRRRKEEGKGGRQIEAKGERVTHKHVHVNVCILQKFIITYTCVCVNVHVSSFYNWMYPWQRKCILTSLFIQSIAIFFFLSLNLGKTTAQFSMAPVLWSYTDARPPTQNQSKQKISPIMKTMQYYLLACHCHHFVTEHMQSTNYTMITWRSGKTWCQTFPPSVSAFNSAI